MKKHKEAIESDPNFKLIDAVKLEMIHVFDRLRFSELNVDFLKDFIVEKGFIIYPRDLYAFFKECRTRYGNENDAFKAVYEVAEKQAARKQQTSNEDMIILSDFVKNELIKLHRDIDYRAMTKQFLMDYVVRKGFITRSTALNFAGVCVEIKSQQKVIRGFFKDIYGIYDLLQPNGHKFPVRNDKLQRYTTLKKLQIPKWPPVVQKMKGVHWYLCRENDGALAVKHQTMIHSSDYLIAEMKQDREEISDFALITSSFITAKHCDV
uniref:Uncharacterized protein n=1 Tax=Panagrolaimus sp. ES5 TaxID=591445 RepID=A0AC34GCE8_9BILA